MPRATERAMLGCFPVVARRPSLPSSCYEEGSTSMSASTASPPTSSTASTSSPAFLDDDEPLYPDDAPDPPEPDAGGLSTAIASRRFFPATPGLSNSIVDSVAVAAHPAQPAAAAPSSHAHAARRSSSASNVRALRRAATSAFPAASSSGAAWSSSSSSSSSASSSSASATKARSHDGGGGGGMQQQPVRKVPVSTDAPRADFLKSMVEMVEALELDPRRRDADLARLHDLLLCYITLNERDALRDILAAFADLMCLLGVTSSTAAAADAGEKRDAAADEHHAGAGR